MLDKNDRVSWIERLGHSDTKDQIVKMNDAILNLLGKNKYRLEIITEG